MVGSQRDARFGVTVVQIGGVGEPENGTNACVHCCANLISLGTYPAKVDKVLQPGYGEAKASLRQGKKKICVDKKIEHPNVSI